jgi:hypothetical protein
VAGGRERREGIRIHRIPSLDQSLTTSRDDLRRTVDAGDLRAAVRQAEILDLPIDAAAIVPDRAASALELAFLELCRRRRIRKPEVNVRVGAYRVDFLWRRERLVVEPDGERYHRGRRLAERRR